jgi:hypothetical protein
MTRSEVEADHKTVRNYIVIVRRMQNVQVSKPLGEGVTTIETRTGTGTSSRISTFVPRDLTMSCWR